MTNASPLVQLTERQQRFYRRLLQSLGWQLQGEVPNITHGLIITEPHQHNWDFPIGFIASRAFGLRSLWVGKQAMFRWPFGGLLRRMGGIAIDRKQPQGVAQQVSQQLLAKPLGTVAIAPSGTRGTPDYWKSGFYRIAQAAQVPIICTYIDTAKKCIGLGLCLHPTGNVAADMQRIRDFYREQLGDLPIIHTMRLKEESQGFN